MNQIDIVKRNIYALYKEHKAVHACIRLRHMKSCEQNSISAVIKAVYANVFEIEEINTKKPKTYTFQYVDVITKEINIQELDGTLPKSIDIKRPRPRKVY